MRHADVSGVPGDLAHRVACGKPRDPSLTQIADPDKIILSRRTRPPTLWFVLQRVERSALDLERRMSQ
jgi:hypothetical protein